MDILEIKQTWNIHRLAHPLNVIQPIRSGYLTHRIKLHCTKLIMCMYLPFGGGGTIFCLTMKEEEIQKHEPYILFFLFVHDLPLDLIRVYCTE